MSESKGSKVKNMIDLMNQRFQKNDINSINKSTTNPLLGNAQNNIEDNGRESFDSIIDKSFGGTFESMPFNEEKDLDLPNFTPTKYNSLAWRLFHSICYFLYTIILLGSTICLLIWENFYNIAMLVAHMFFFVSSFIQWFYYKRGCIGKSNYNSQVKNNIDRSSKAALLRSEEGWKYFFTLFGCCILIYGNIYYFFLTLDEQQYPDFWNINLIGTMIISLSQILKLEKIITQNKTYAVKNDISNVFIEIFLFFGSLLFGGSYYIQILYNLDTIIFNRFIIIIKFIGNGFIILSGLCLIHRYFFSDYDDLNVSDLSNITL